MIRTNTDKRNLTITTIVFAVTVASSTLDASWLSDITGINIDVPRGRVEIGRPNPAAIPRMLENLPKDLGQALLSPHGQVLSTAIRHAAERAREGSRPIPLVIQQQLAPYFPPEVLATTRWNIYDPNRFALDTAVIGVGQWFDREQAITLDNVIVFPQRADTNPAFFNARNPETRRLWAHELTHVMQYRNMGIEGFATFYSVNWDSLEAQARVWSNRIEGLLENDDDPNAVRRPRYVQAAASREIGTPMLTANHFAAAARQYYPASSCIAIHPMPQQYAVRNVCPVPIAVTGWNFQNPISGLGFMPCNFDCAIPPGATKPIGNALGPIVSVGYRY